MGFHIVKNPCLHRRPPSYPQTQRTHAQMAKLAIPVSPIHEFRSVHGECPDIPDDLSIPQFFLDSWHPLRPRRPAGSPWVIDDESGNGLDYEQVSKSPPYPTPSSRTSFLRSDRGVMVLHSLSRRGGGWVSVGPFGSE